MRVKVSNWDWQRISVTVGFVVSFVGVIITAFALSEINNNLNTIDTEQSRLTEMLRQQTVNGNESETKFQNYRQMYHLANLVAPTHRAEAKDDAAVILDDALLFLFVAANDFSMTEIRKLESEQLTSDEAEIGYEELKDGAKIKRTASQAESNKSALDAALHELASSENLAENDVLRKKIVAINAVSSNAAQTETDAELMLELYPVARMLSEKWNKSVKEKQEQIVVFEAERKRLIATRGNYTFAAIVLQIVSLACVFIKDFLK